jgi:hypothetical protein
MSKKLELTEGELTRFTHLSDDQFEFIKEQVSERYGPDVFDLDWDDPEVELRVELYPSSGTKEDRVIWLREILKESSLRNIEKQFR